MSALFLRISVSSTAATLLLPLRAFVHIISLLVFRVSSGSALPSHLDSRPYPMSVFVLTSVPHVRLRTRVRTPCPSSCARTYPISVFVLASVAHVRLRARENRRPGNRGHAWRLDKGRRQIESKHLTTYHNKGLLLPFGSDTSSCQRGQARVNYPTGIFVVHLLLFYYISAHRRLFRRAIVPISGKRFRPVSTAGSFDRTFVLPSVHSA